MILYVNGDSHSAGAEAVNSFCFAEDDPQYVAQGRRPHPDNLEVSFGKHLTKILNCGFALDAESGASNDRILRTTKRFLEEHSKQDIFVLIGWTTPEREEWLHEGEYYQVNASGIDIVPSALQEKYKQFVADCTPEYYKLRLDFWQQTIYNLHLMLEEQGIKHLFFNTFNQFENLDWNGCFVEEVYFDFLKEKGFKTKNPDSYHFGADAHRAWAGHLIKYIQKLL